MNYPLKGGQTSEDILFWMVEQARTRFPGACMYMEGEMMGRQRLSLGLDDGMYARCCPLDEPFDLWLERDNGDAIVYEAAFPRMLRVTGLDSFVQEVMALPQPPHHMVLFYGNLWTRGQFRISDAFLALSAAEQLRCCLRMAGSAGLKMLVSSAENGARAVPAATGATLLGYRELVDIVLRRNGDTWILLHLTTGMIYTSGLELTAAEELLENGGITAK